MTDNDLSVIHLEETVALPLLGPPAWEPNVPGGPPFWEGWRMELWHEVVHQVQDQKNFCWHPGDGKNGHRLGWRSAVGWVAVLLNAPQQKLYELMASNDTPPW